MVTVDSTVSKLLRARPLEESMTLMIDNRAITTLFEQCMDRAAIGERSLVYVHTRHQIRPFFVRGFLSGDHDIKSEVMLTPRLSTFYTYRIDVWINNKGRVIIFDTSKESV